MEEKTTIQQSGFPIMGNATLFIVPFHYGVENEDQPAIESAQNCIISEDDDSLWTLETKMLTDEGEGSVIYPYIMSFLQGQMMDSEGTPDGHLMIYSIADIDRRDNPSTKIESRPIIGKFWNKFVQSEHSIDVGTKYEPHLLKFRFNNGRYNTLKPHIFIFPSARIGLLTFGIELTSPDATSNDLKLLNYHLHKIAKPFTKCVCKSLSITNEDQGERRVEKENTFNYSRMYIEGHKDKKSNDENGNIDFSWNMKTFIDMMLKDVHGITYSENNKIESQVELFTPPRIHLFTYCCIDDSQLNQYSKDDILLELYRLSRCVNDKYLLPFEEMNFHDGYLQTFDNVYVASTVEGTAFIVFSKEQISKFFENFIGILSMRYVWVYLLVMVQRYSLLNMDRMLSILEANETKIKIAMQNEKPKGESDKSQTIKHSAMLWRLLDTIRKVKVRCHYTEISPYTQHNEFYKHCCEKLHVSNAFEEIDHKTKVLNMTMEHDLQKLQEANEKERNERDERMNLFLAIFAALQGISVLYSLIEECCKENYSNAVIYSILILIAVALVYILYRKHK